MISDAAIADEIRAIAASLHDTAFRDVFLHYSLMHTRRFAWLLGEFEAEAARAGRALRVVDAGSFPGTLPLLLRRRGFEVTALGRRVEGYDSNAGFEQALANAGIAFVDCDIERDFAALPSESFDHALFTEVIEHLPFNPFHAMAELCRLLRGDGRIWMSTPNMACARYVLLLLRGQSMHPPVSDPWSQTFPTTPGAKHEREYTAAELRYFLAPNAPHLYWFEDVRVEWFEWIGERPWDRMSGLMRMAERVMCAVAPRFRSGLFARATKPRGLHLFSPDEIARAGSWRARQDPVEEARYPYPAAWPYSYQYMTGEVELRFRMPGAGEGGGGGERREVVLPMVWPAMTPSLGRQEVRYSWSGSAGGVGETRDGESGSMVMIKPSVAGIVPVRFSVPREITGGEDVTLRLAPVNAVVPDSILGNGDREPIAPGLAEAHWAIVRQ